MVAGAVVLLRRAPEHSRPVLAVVLAPVLVMVGAAGAVVGFGGDPFGFMLLLAWVVFFSGRATRGQKWALFGILVPGVLLAAYSSFSDKSLAMTLMMVPLVARWYAKRKMPWTFMVVTLLLLVFIIFPLYNTFRWFDHGIGRSERST